MPTVQRIMRGAALGAVAAGAWLGVEPLLRLASHAGSYDERRLLGRLITPDGPWRAVGTAVHLADGAVFGAVFTGLGGRGLARGVLAAIGENAALWPSFLVLDRVHPDRRSGEWPSLFSDRRILAHEVLGHVVFGAVLGGLTGLADRPG